MQQLNGSEPAFGAILLGNLNRVFNERNAARRLEAMAEFWAEDAVMFEADTVHFGLKAISDNVGAVQARLPEDIRFMPAGEAIANHGSAMLRWQAGSEDGRTAVSGTDIAMFKNQRIHSMHVYLDPF
ncbi:nuclear transport factor 2 family protein [Novosphingobium sp.]|uniref:nuclear transport factor 2 family protein n=1 Tax=Novosphingobium sp. TaxID=1874826 RepID=UPI0031D6CA97